MEGITVGTSSEILSDVAPVYQVGWEKGKFISSALQSSFLRLVRRS